MTLPVPVWFKYHRVWRPLSVSTNCVGYSSVTGAQFGLITSSGLWLLGVILITCGARSVSPILDTTDTKIAKFVNLSKTRKIRTTRM